MIAFVLGRFGVAGVFTMIAACMGVVVLAIGLFGPRVTTRSLEEISR